MKVIKEESIKDLLKSKKIKLEDVLKSGKVEEAEKAVDERQVEATEKIASLLQQAIVEIKKNNDDDKDKNEDGEMEEIIGSLIKINGEINKTLKAFSDKKQELKVNVNIPERPKIWEFEVVKRNNQGFIEKARFNAIIK